MKKHLLLGLAILMVMSGYCQEKIKLREVGFILSSVNNFGFTYRTGTTKALWRFNSLFVSGLNNIGKADSSEIINKNIGVGFAFGREFRKSITSRIEGRIGLEISFQYANNYYKNTYSGFYSNTQSTHAITYRTGIGFLTGLNFKITPEFIVGFEILPNISYTTGQIKEKQTNLYYNFNREFNRKIAEYTYGFNTGSVLLSFIYRF